MPCQNINATISSADVQAVKDSSSDFPQSENIATGGLMIVRRASLEEGLRAGRITAHLNSLY
jgi:hypothetical protein